MKNEAYARSECKISSLLRRNWHIAVFVAVAACVNTLAQTPDSTTYSDAASWSTAVAAEVGAPTAINLQAISPLVSVSNISADVGSNGVELYQEGGQANGYNDNITLSFPSPVTAVGFDLGEYNNSGFQYVVTLSDGEDFTVSYTGTSTFFGVISDVPISTVTIGELLPYWASDYVQVQNLQLATVNYAPVSFPAQAMEGNLLLNPGATLKVGYDFTIPGSHPSAVVRFAPSQVSFSYSCPSSSGTGTLNVPIVAQTYTDPQGSSAWLPSGNQQSPSTFQGQVSVPDVCSGGEISFRAGGTFTGGICSTDNSDSVHLRWHYSGNGSAGGWSGTKSVTPISCQ